MSSKNLSRDQKRKAKLAEKNKKSREFEVFQPYPGAKYRSDFWTPVMLATEVAIHDTILESNRTLTNDHVKQTLILLIEHLRSGGPAIVADGEVEIVYAATAVKERLFFNIRQAWRKLADAGRAVAATDLIGVLRTLLGSIDAQALRTGASRGYVTFLEDFIPEIMRSQSLTGE